jgi:hypothetical protein
MSRKDKGHFGAKHEGVSLDETIAAELRGRVRSGGLSCAEAEGIATKKKVAMKNVGVAMDLLEIRIDGCQLGLFGDESGEKAVKPLDHVPEPLRLSIEKALSGGRLPCADAWRIAGEQGRPRKDVSSACEALGIKICACQLGAF